jgi:hypothetical protein
MKPTHDISNSNDHDVITPKRRKYFVRLKKGLIKDIVEIEVKIHQIWVTGQYTLTDLQEFFGRLAITPAQSNRAGYYQKIAYKWRNERKFTILSSPTKGYIPQSKIEIPNPSQRLLFNLLNQFPDLAVSKAEYTIDVFYHNPKEVRRYFYLLRRYAYFRFQRNITFYSDKKNLKNSKRNMTLYAGAIKIYERGDDEDKISYAVDKKGWPYDKMDRVRIEVSADNPILKNHDVVDLSKFLESVKFEDIFINRLLFKRFVSSAKRLPQEYGHYKNKDSSGHGASFSAEFEYAKKIYKNRAQFITDVSKFIDFKKLLICKIREFEDKWSRHYKKYTHT